MSKPKKSSLSPRKQPEQERSAQLVEAILQAAVRALERHGAAGFNTIRVAEQAGVSVGSLYQYFPNKQSILFRLQDEWKQTGEMLDAIFADTRHGAADRLHLAVRTFFRSERDEMALRQALDSAAPLFFDAPEALQQRQRRLPMLLALLDEIVPGIPLKRRAFAGELFMAQMIALGEHVSEPEGANVDTWAAASADMFLAYLHTLARAASG